MHAFTFMCWLFCLPGKRVLVVNGAYRGKDACLLSLNEKKFCCSVRLESVRKKFWRSTRVDSVSKRRKGSVFLSATQFHEQMKSLFAKRDISNNRVLRKSAFSASLDFSRRLAVFCGFSKHTSVKLSMVLVFSLRLFASFMNCLNISYKNKV